MTTGTLHSWSLSSLTGEGKQGCCKAHNSVHRSEQLMLCRCTCFLQVSVCFSLQFRLVSQVMHRQHCVVLAPVHHWARANRKLK
jgi:hypothetical protein